MKIRAVSLFCGAGGFCEGARMAGWQVVAAVESDAQACGTHSANFPEVKLHEGDIAGHPYLPLRIERLVGSES